MHICVSALCVGVSESALLSVCMFAQASFVTVLSVVHHICLVVLDFFELLFHCVLECVCVCVWLCVCLIVLHVVWAC